MDTFLILLRVLHILASVFWVGGAAVLTLFVEPGVRATAPDSRRFMQHLMGPGRFPVFMSVSSTLAVLSGALLLWQGSGGLQAAWLKTGFGLCLTAGSIIGIVVYAMGMLMIKPRVERLKEIGHAITSAGAPTAAQLDEIIRLEGALAVIGRTDFVLLVLALGAMGAARYVLWV